MFIGRIVVFICFVLLFQEAFSQQKFTLSGTIADDSSGEDLAGAVVVFQNSGYSTICNLYGFYSITVPEGDYDNYCTVDGL